MCAPLGLNATDSTRQGSAPPGDESSEEEEGRRRRRRRKGEVADLHPAAFCSFSPTLALSIAVCVCVCGSHNSVSKSSHH